MGMMDTACPHCGSHDPETIQYIESYFGSYGKGMPKFEDIQSGYNGSGTITEEQLFKCDHCGKPFVRRVIFESVTYHD